jgi:hypothetical protein
MIRDFDDTKLYVVIGSARALLVDAGLGTGDLRGLVEALIGDRPSMQQHTAPQSGAVCCCEWRQAAWPSRSRGWGATGKIIFAIHLTYPINPLRQQAQSLRMNDGLDTIMNVKLAVQVLEVHLHRALGYHQLVRDLLIRMPQRQQAQYVDLSFAQRLQQSHMVGLRHSKIYDL